MHRISDVSMLSEKIISPKHFSLDSFIDSGAMHVLSSEQPVELYLRCDKPALLQLLESPLSENQKISNCTDDNFEVQVTVQDSQDLRWWLLAQSPHLDIVEPIWLRQELTNTLKKAIERHQ